MLGLYWRTGLVVLFLMGLALPAQAQDIFKLPNLVGLSESQARQRLKELGSVGRITVVKTTGEKCTSGGANSNAVCAQGPAPGRMHGRDMDIWLAVKAGVAVKQFPNVKGSAPDRAEAMLRRYGFTGKIEVVGTTEKIRCPARNQNYHTGKICGTIPGATQRASVDTEIKFLVQGKRYLNDAFDYIPNVVGKPWRDARAALTEFGFKHISYVFLGARRCPKPNIVCRTSPPAGQLFSRNPLDQRGDRIALYIGGIQESAGKLRVGELAGLPLDKVLDRLNLLGARGRINPYRAERANDCAPRFQALEEGIVCNQSLRPDVATMPGATLGLVLAPKPVKVLKDATAPFPTDPDVKSKLEAENTAGNKPKIEADNPSASTENKPENPPAGTNSSGDLKFD